MKAVVKYLIITITSIIVAIITFFVGLSVYYSNVFPYGIYINGMYCTGMTVEEVNDKLLTKCDLSEATIIIEGNEYSIDLEELGYNADYTDSLANLYADCRKNSFIGNLFNEKKDLAATPVYSFDQNTLTDIAKSWELEEIGAPHDVKLVVNDDNGYEIVDGKGNEYSLQKVTGYISANLCEGNVCIEVDDTCFADVEYTEEELELFALVDKIDQFQTGSYVFKLDNTEVTLSATDLAGMLSINEFGLPSLDENGNLLIDKQVVKDGLYDALSPYNTYHNHTFTTHDGRKVYLATGTYGNEINIDAVADDFYEALSSGNKNYYCVPEYKNKANFTGDNDIGNTYVEVSLDEQKLFYFENGVIKLTSDVVTGNKSYHYDTPEGVYAVFVKQKNRTLVGETYRSFVKYWIEFYPHYGLHDASWRKEGAFGGDIYLTNGSHGCVNMPTEKVAEAYDLIEKGTPVIVYSYSNSKVK